MLKTTFSTLYVGEESIFAPSLHAFPSRSHKYPIKRVTNTAFGQPLVELRDACYSSWNNPYFASGSFASNPRAPKLNPPPPIPFPSKGALKPKPAPQSQPSFVAQARPAPFKLEGDVGGGGGDEQSAVVDQDGELVSPKRLARRSSERRLMEADFNPLADDFNDTTFDNPLAEESYPLADA